MSYCDKSKYTSQMNKTFGEHIKQLRTKSGMTLTQLAARLDLDSGNLSKIENGKREFDEKRLEKLAFIFKHDIEFLKDELFSDKFANIIYSNSCTDKALELAEQKVRYLRQSNVKQKK